MNGKEPIKIVRNFSDGDIQCLGCGCIIHLYFNGGELDRQECCGYTYQTEAPEINLCIYKEEN